MDVIVSGQRMHLRLARQPPKGTGKNNFVVIRMKRRTPLFILNRPMAEPLSAEELVPIHGHGKSLGFPVVLNIVLIEQIKYPLAPLFFLTKYIQINQAV
jgi:hypothetical protein